jgi:phosphohistidine swiveling domain-containing protein
MFFLGDRKDRMGGDIKVGRKALNLHLLKAKDYAVPPGFVLPQPEVSAGELSKAVEAIGGFPVAVRSSGQLEDMPHASFAGMYETFLGISSEEELKARIHACFISEKSERVGAYLKARHLSPACPEPQGQFAVIVQKMVAVEVAGVAFSIDPISGKEEHFVLEVCAGLGDRLVSGLTVPSRYVVGIESLNVVSYDPGKEKIKLPPMQLEAIRDSLLNIQSEFEYPQDVEWAIDAQGKLWILQSRPITYIAWRTDLGEFTNADLKDGGVSSRVCTPMMFSLYNECFSKSLARYLTALTLIKPNARENWMTHSYGRVYWNAGLVKQALFKIPGFNERDFDLDLGIEKDYGAEGPQMTPVSLKTVVRAIPILIGLKREYRRCRRMIERFQKDFNALNQVYLAEIKRFRIDSHADFFAKLNKMIQSYYFSTEMSYFRALYNNTNYQADFKKLVQKMDQRIGGETPLNELMLGLSEVSHLEIQEGIIKLARTAKAHSCRSLQWQTALQDFIGRHYFQGDTALDIKTPRWGESPETVVARVDSLLRTGIEPVDPATMSAEQRKRYIRAHQQVMDRIEKSSIGVRILYRRAFPAALAQLRHFIISKEKMRTFSTQSYYVVRHFLLEAERRLLNLGILRDPDDVFCLHIEELLDLSRKWQEVKKNPIHKRIAFRKKMYQSFKSFNPPNEFGHKLTGRSETNIVYGTDGGRQLKGIGCSPGIYEGRARIIEDLSEIENIRTGEVLVTKYTDPAWTPVLGVVSAVVTEVGGILSHAAVISREYGIPAVLNSIGATQIIRNGQWVRVDGDRGTITLG